MVKCCEKGYAWNTIECLKPLEYERIKYTSLSKLKENQIKHIKKITKGQRSKLINYATAFSRVEWR